MKWDAPATAELAREHGLSRQEYERILPTSAACPTSPNSGSSRRCGRALLVQVLPRPPEEVSDERARGSSRVPARTPASWTSGTGGPPSSRWSRTTTPRSSSPTRARRRASAASCATSSRWARGPSPTSTRSASAALDAPAHARTSSTASSRGIGGYGNCIGVPTRGRRGGLRPALRRQHPRQRHVTCGVARADRIFYGRAAGVGNPVIYVGSKTGRDGIHGATMASDESRRDAAAEAPHGAGGRPVHREAAARGLPGADRAKGLLVGIQDMGAAGLTSSSRRDGRPRRAAGSTSTSTRAARARPA